MRILTDETVSRSTIVMLRGLGHDVADVREAGISGAPDEDVCVHRDIGASHNSDP